MLLTTFVVYLLTNGLLHRASNAEETIINSWCEAPDVIEGMTAVVIFHTDVDITQQDKNSLAVIQNDSPIIIWNNSTQNYIVKPSYEFYDNFNLLFVLFIRNVTHNHTAEYMLTYENIKDPRPCNLTVMKVDHGNKYKCQTDAKLLIEGCQKTCGLCPKNETVTAAPENALAVDFSKRELHASNITVPVLITVFLSSGVTFALTVAALYFAYKFRCLFFKTGVTKQQIPENIDTGDSLLSTPE